ncbi:MAG TPA: hypothetical protein VLX85_13450 [Stellaceae bacterium]|nr:hypothetical protein [Stellaceae bacterium]
MRSAPRLLLVVIFLTLSIAPAAGDVYVYGTALGLYEDCAAGEGENSAVADEKHRHCTDYIGVIFNDWNLSQDIGVCSRHFGSELRTAYVDYWRARGLGFPSGIFLSAETSVREFLDSQTQPCPKPNPKANPP